MRSTGFWVPRTVFDILATARLLAVAGPVALSANRVPGMPVLPKSIAAAADEAPLCGLSLLKIWTLAVNPGLTLMVAALGPLQRVAFNK